MRLCDLLKIANLVIKEVHKYIPYSSNRPFITNQPFNSNLWLSIKRAPNDAEGLRKRLRDNLTLDLDDLNVSPPHKRRRLHQVRLPGTSYPPTYQQLFKYFYESSQNKIDYKYHKDGSRYTHFHRLENDAKNSVRFGIGNCGEMATLALMLLAEYPKEGLDGFPRIDDEKVIVELMSLGDHVFVVINRDQQSEISDVSSWGNGAVILDPWMNEVVLITDNNLLKQIYLLCSKWYQYVSNNGETISRYPTDYTYISEGHSRRWIEHREDKDEPQNLRDWQPLF